MICSGCGTPIDDVNGHCGCTRPALPPVRSEPLLACGHRAGDQYMQDGKCGTCCLIAEWQGMADDAGNSDRLREACRQMVDMLKAGDLYYCRDGTTLHDLQMQANTTGLLRQAQEGR